MIFQNLIWTLSGLVGATLQLLLIHIFLRGRWKKYPFLFAFLVVTFLITVVEAAEFWKLVAWSDLGVHLYWTNEIITQALAFSVVISLMYAAGRDSGQRAPRLRLFTIGALLVMLLLVSVAYSPVSLTRWMTGATRNLSFASAILNLFLWSSLLARRKRDPELMLICSAFGIQTTGKALGHSLRVLGFPWLGNPLIPITYILSLAILWSGFRRMAAKSEAVEA